jgi:hypothetical protein
MLSSSIAHNQKSPSILVITTGQIRTEFPSVYDLQSYAAAIICIGKYLSVNLVTTMNERKVANE